MKALGPLARWNRDRRHLRVSKALGPLAGSVRDILLARGSRRSPRRDAHFVRVSHCSDRARAEPATGPRPFSPPGEHALLSLRSPRSRLRRSLPWFSRCSNHAPFAQTPGPHSTADGHTPPQPIAVLVAHSVHSCAPHPLSEHALTSLRSLPWFSRCSNHAPLTKTSRGAVLAARA